MSRIVDALVEEGLVKREVNSSDRRSVTISPTQRGVHVMQEGRARREKQLFELLKRLGPDEVGIIQRATEILSRVLQSGASSA